MYYCLLDARKAFDTDWYPRLLYKLSQMGCNIDVWRILWDYYQGFQCSVFVAGSQTEWFQVGQGVHQGGPFSIQYALDVNRLFKDSLHYPAIHTQNLQYSVILVLQ